jgi:hypothetical protein
MHWNRSALATALMAGFVCQAGRANDPPQISVISFEDTSCGTWVRSASQRELRQVYLYWFRGFLSGYNYGAPTKQVPLAASPDDATLTLFVDKFCREHPLNPFVSAAFDLVKELRPKR